MKKLSTKEIVLLVLLVFIVSGALYYNYYFRPYQDKMLDLETSIATNTQKLLTLQNQQQSIIEDTARLNNELLGVQDDLGDIPTGVDEPNILVFIEEALTGLADNSAINFPTDYQSTEFFQINNIYLSFNTDYDSLKMILDNFNNAPFRNRINSITITYNEPAQTLGPEIVSGTNPVADVTGTEAEEEQEVEKIYYLEVKLVVECFSIPGEIPEINYPFMIGPYNNSNPFIEFGTQ